MHALCRGAGSDRDWTGSGLIGIENGNDWVQACHYIASIVIPRVAGVMHCILGGKAMPRRRVH